MIIDFINSNLICRTIHGLIYNALKLFMEMNQKLFDECTQSYSRQRDAEKQQFLKKVNEWKVIQQKAYRNRLVDFWNFQINLVHVNN